MILKRICIIGVLIVISGASIAQTVSGLVPIRLHAGVNGILNIAGDGRPGAISLTWRDNGNAWGYDIFSVTVGNNVVTNPLSESGESFRDSPHTGDDMVTSVRFAHGSYGGRVTTFALVANRHWQNSVPEAARTTISILVLVRNSDGPGTPYEFRVMRRFMTKRQYCNADMALHTELGFPLAGSYQGSRASDGC